MTYGSDRTAPARKLAALVLRQEIARMQLDLAHIQRQPITQGSFLMASPGYEVAKEAEQLETMVAWLERKDAP